jgi:ComF family protein
MIDPGRLWSALQDLLVPRRCPLCRTWLDPERPEEPVCPACRAEHVRRWDQVCLICGRPWSEPDSWSETCPACLRRRPPFRAARFAAAYQGHLAQAIRDFKYRRRLELTPTLGWLLAQADPGPAFPDRFDLVLPVPLHPRRLRGRGFNQSALLAGHLAERGELRLDLLLRLRPTRPQVELQGWARRTNVNEAFGVARPEPVQGRSILVVDDVLTSGSTVEACARALLHAGAGEVFVLTLARALGK